MTRFPEEIKVILKKLEDAGEKAYVTGGSMRDCMREKQPKDWDLTTTALPEKVRELFPDANPIGERFGVFRVREGETEADLATLREEQSYTDHRRPDQVQFTLDVEKDLARRDYTVNAMAMGSDGVLIDPFDGARDLQNRLIRVVGDPVERLEEDPLRVLRGIRFAARLDFDIEMKTFQGMQENACMLPKISMERRKDEFERIITSRHAGKGLRMCVAAGVLPALVGDCFPPRGRQEHGNLEILIQNIDRTKKDTRQAELRMAMLLLCFEPRLALQAIENLNYSSGTTKKLTAAVKDLTDFWYANTGMDIKRFIYRHGWEVYDFLFEVTKMERDIYDCPAYRIESKYYIVEEFKRFKEPIFVEDLAITGQDLIDAGIAEGPEVGRLLTMLTELSHRLPGLNTKKKLLARARRIKRNPLAQKTSGIHWLR